MSPGNLASVTSNVLSSTHIPIKYIFITALKELDLDIDYEYLVKGESKSDIVFVHYKNLNNIKSKYKLIIFDDVTYFSDINIGITAFF